jgi:hypothetical protein
LLRREFAARFTVNPDFANAKPVQRLTDLTHFLQAFFCGGSQDAVSFPIQNLGLSE